MDTNKEQTEVQGSLDVFKRELPDLSKAEAAPLPINGEYWSPAAIGETRRMFFKDIQTEVVIDRMTGKDIELPVAYFVEPRDGKNYVVRQGGCRLVSVFDSFVKSGRIVPGMAFEITYTGKQKTNTGNFVDTWTITPLVTRR